MPNRTRREWLGVVGAVGIGGIAGCRSSDETATEGKTTTGEDTATEEETTTKQEEMTTEEGEPTTEARAASLVEEYYTAAAAGDLEEAASTLFLTQLDESGEGVSIEEMTGLLQDEYGMSEDGIDVSLGEFTQLSPSAFATFTFSDEDGEQQEFTEEDVAEIVPEASAFGGDDEAITLVHHTGGFVPDIWVPYQPTEEPTDGHGEVIVYVGPFDGEPSIIGDFRSYTDLKVTTE